MLDDEDSTETINVFRCQMRSLVWVDKPEPPRQLMRAGLVALRAAEVKLADGKPTSAPYPYLLVGGGMPEYRNARLMLNQDVTVVEPLFQLPPKGTPLAEQWVTDLGERDLAETAATLQRIADMVFAEALSKRPVRERKIDGKRPSIPYPHTVLAIGPDGHCYSMATTALGKKTEYNMDWRNMVHDCLNELSGSRAILMNGKANFHHLPKEGGAVAATAAA